ncbi:MAG: flavin reductase family protein [Candidatus Omnitrophota bacterium]|jgi:flavin reductase (DIM6/NTAB) family NADH-FMN oxidoreductase RutF|nr:flavin reductase family protein [Candidatus Omnitrophota bacterium]
MSKLELLPSEALYPVPVVLVSCGNRDLANIITIAWCGVACSKPPLLTISIRPSRYSNNIIKNSGEFVINIPTKDLLKETDICGTISGCDKDKFDLCNFTKADSSIVKSPIIKECPTNIECRVINVLNLGTHDMFIGEAVKVHRDRSILDKKGNIDYSGAAPIVYNQGEYWSLGKRIGRYGFSAK